MTTGSLFKYLILFLSMQMIFASCTVGDDCPLTNQKTKLILSVSVLNVSDQDITDTGVAGNVFLYIFDDNQKFIDKIVVPSIDIQNKEPITLEYANVTDYWVVAWSNLNEKQKVTTLSKGMPIQQGLVQLQKNSENYAINPDDLFWGIKFFPGPKVKSQTSLGTDVIPLTMKRMTARMYITVKGLDRQHNDYRFVISGANQDTYTFNGQLIGNQIDYGEAGMFDTNSYFVSLMPFSMFPLLEGDYNTISIYQGSNLIASAHINSQDGSNIVPKVGVTNNVFIDLSNFEQPIPISIKVSDWNEVHQWVEW